MQFNSCDSQDAVDIFNVTFNVGNQILCRLDLAHVQCGSQGTGKSPCDTSNHVIEGGRVFGSGNRSTVLLLIEVFDSTMDSEVNRLLETLDVCGPMRSLMLFDSDSAGMRYGHGGFPRVKMFWTQLPSLRLSALTSIHTGCGISSNSVTLPKFHLSVVIRDILKYA